jgi:hypothetical protein
VRGIEGKSICAFSKDSTHVVVVCEDGNFIVSNFEEGGDCPRISTNKFMKSQEDIREVDGEKNNWANSGLGKEN